MFSVSRFELSLGRLFVKIVFEKVPFSATINVTVKIDPRGDASVSLLPWSSPIRGSTEGTQKCHPPTIVKMGGNRTFRALMAIGILIKAPKTSQKFICQLL